MKKTSIAMSVATVLGLVGAVANASVVAGTGAAGAATPGIGGFTATFNAGVGTGGQATLSDATTLVLNPGGIGHILLIPYFTAQNGNATAFSITNTDTRNGKAVKVRFRGAANSDDILDFQVYLSPGDVWAASVSSVNGVPSLTVPDNSCTVPSTVAGTGVGATAKSTTTPFGTSRVLNNSVAQTFEGYVEIFNMADIPPQGTTGTSALYTAIKHVAGMPPCGAPLQEGGAAVVDVATTATAAKAAENDFTARGFDTPSTGLYANWTIINVPNATSYSGTATAIEARTAATVAAVPAGLGRGNFVHFPQLTSQVAGVFVDTTGTAITNLNNAGGYTADPLLSTLVGVAGGVNGHAIQGSAANPRTGAAIQALSVDLPDLSTPYIAQAVPAATVTAAAASATAVQVGAFAAQQASDLANSIAKLNIQNDYWVDPAYQATTDWVFSQPTRRYAVALDYAPSAGTSNLPLWNDAVVGNVPAFGANNISVQNNQICVKLPNGTITTYDRSEASQALGSSGSLVAVSPAIAGIPYALCGEASVLSFNANGKTSSLGALIARTDVTPNGLAGWANIASTPDGTSPLPVLGSAFTSAFNPNAAQGVAGSYGEAFPHRTWSGK